MDQKNPFDLLQHSLNILQRVKTETIIYKSSSWVSEIDELQLALELIKLHKHDTNHHIILDGAITYIHNMIFIPFSQMIDKINKNNLRHKDFKEDIEYFIMKIKFIRQWIPKVINTDMRCIFRQNRHSPEWKILDKFINYIDLDTPKNVQKKLDNFMRNIVVGCAYSMLGLRYQNPIKRVVIQNLGGLYYILQYEKCRKINLSLINNIHLSYASGLWGALDRCEIPRIILKSIIVGVKLNQKIYLPRLFAPITLDVIYDEIANNKVYDFQQFNRLDMADNLYESLSEPLKLKRNKASKVKVRLLSDRKHIMRKHIDIEGAIDQVTNISSTHFQISATKSNYQSEANPIKNVIIHLHGGGWVAMSSFSHQMYTRKWANQLGPDCLIVSVDYRLTPDFPYPHALDDCWQVYLWIIYFSKFYLNVDPSKIIIAGDSAGGNMALGICLRSLRLGVQLPDGLLLSYPAMNLDLNNYSPSLLFSLNDLAAPITILEEVLKTYMKSEGLRPDLDPYLSPGISDERFLRALPDKLTIICGSQDTLKDECIKFLNRLNIAKKLSKPNPYPVMHIYNGFPHGFLNFDFMMGIQIVSHVVEHCGDIIQEYLL